MAAEATGDTGSIQRALGVALLPIAGVFLAAPALGPLSGAFSDPFGRPALVGVALGVATGLFGLALRRCPPRLGLAVVSAAYTAVLVVASFWIFSVPFRYRTRMALEPPPAVGIWRTDERYGYVHVPGQRSRQMLPWSFDVAVEIDDDGCRRAPAPLRSDSEALFLGGSITFGHGVEGDEAFPAVLGQRSWKHTTIRNCAVSGWGTAHAYLFLEDALARGMRPDVVLYGWVAQHRQRNGIGRSWVETMARYDRRHPWFDLAGDRLVYRGTVGLDESLPDAEAWPKTRRLTIELLLGLNRMAAAAGVPFVVVRLSDVGNDALILSALARAAVPVVDVSAAEGGRLRFDFHPDAVWHADVARRLASAPALLRLELAR